MVFWCLCLSACQDDDKTEVSGINFSEFQDPRDGKVYKCMTIGGDTWLAENLSYYVPGGFYSGCFRYNEAYGGKTLAQFQPWLQEVYENGRIGEELYNECLYLMDKNGGNIRIPRTLLTIIGYKFPQDILDELMTYDPGYAEKYGYLYSYEAMRQAVIPGWEIPTDEDWKRLEQSVGMSVGEADRMEAWRGKGEAERLLDGETGIGFDVKLGGARVYHSDDRDGVFEGKVLKTIFWSADTVNGNEEGYLSVVRTFLMNDNRIWRGTAKRTGTAYALRCIRRGK